MFNDNKSRERKARIYDGLAVSMLLILMMALGVIVWAASAKAEPDSNVVAFAAEYGPAACSVLDQYPTTDGMMGVLTAITEQGMTDFQAGQVVGIAVTHLCPRHAGVLARFVAQYGRQALT